MSAPEQSVAPTLAAASRGSMRWFSMAFASVLAIAAVVAVVYWPTSRSLVAAWEDTVNLTYTHGYLILGLFVWLLWRDREALQARVARASIPAAVLLMLASLVWLVVVRAGIDLAGQLLLPFLGWLAVWALLGRSVALRCAFPFAYLYFAIPVWDLSNEMLQHLTVDAVRILLQVTGVPAFIDGNEVHIPAGSFEIAGGCSGLHFLIVGLAIGALYGEVYRDSLRNRLLLLGMAGALALATNWLRVYIIILAGHLTDMQHYLVRVSHYYFGWGVFLVAIIAFALLARRLPVDERQAVSAVELPPDLRVTRPPALVAIGLTVCALLVGPVVNLLTQRTASMTNATALPMAMLKVMPLASPAWQPVFLGADQESHQAYDIDGRYVEVFIAAYASQRQGKEMVSYDNTVLGKWTFEVLSQAATEEGGSGWQEYELCDSNGRQWLLWTAYEVGGRRFVRGLYSQLWYGVASLGNAAPSRVIALRSGCTPSCADARQGLAKALTELGLTQSAASSAGNQ